MNLQYPLSPLCKILHIRYLIQRLLKAHLNPSAKRQVCLLRELTDVIVEICMNRYFPCNRVCKKPKKNP